MDKQVKLIKSKGILLGPRLKDGRMVFTYMLQTIFVEVYYKDDKPYNPAEKINIINGIKNLNTYLEEEFKSSFE